ncbi:hypothetical protein BSB_30380 [Bacillus stercoris]|nr:hypothetical protein BSB_30380 [Bacillus stercoris]
MVVSGYFNDGRQRYKREEFAKLGHSGSENNIYIIPHTSKRLEKLKTFIKRKMSFYDNQISKGKRKRNR